MNDAITPRTLGFFVTYALVFHSSGRAKTLTHINWAIAITCDGAGRIAEGQRIAGYNVLAQDATSGLWLLIANGTTVGSTRVQQIGFGTGNPPAKPPTRVVNALKVDITASYSDDGVLPKLRSAGVFLPPP